ncbi:MAG: hypothetical protein OEY97_13440 [Nitrospirota bacterium]|nr:hypothetical protein [Nitrospirota bacterium]
MKMVRKGWIVAVAVALGVFLGATQGIAADAAAPEAPKPPKKMVIDGTVNGVLRVPELAVWSCAGGQMGGCNLVGRLAHGTQVLRFESEKARGLKWFRIEAGDVKGWVISDHLAMPK